MPRESIPPLTTHCLPPFAAPAGAGASEQHLAPGGHHHQHGPPSHLPVLKVLNLNTWGLNWPWSKDRSYRYKAITEIIALSNYDVILLQEVWYRADYEVLRKALPYVTHFESYNVWCKWLYLPLLCSGLTILSRHPIVDQDFLPFSRRGSFWNFDGEIFVNKVHPTK